MKDIDCLIVGCNQMRFGDYAQVLESMGPRSGAYRDIRPSYFKDETGYVTCRDFCNRLHGTGEVEMSYDDILSATIGYLGTFLHNRGFTFDFVNSFQEGKSELEAALRTRRVRSVAITTTYYVSALPLLEVMQFVRSIDPDVKIVVGGPFIRTQFEIHAKEAFQFLLRQIDADFYVVSHQGELTLVKLLEALKSGGRYQGIPNLFYRDPTDFVCSSLASEDNDLSGNLTDWQLFATSRRKRKMVMVRTARSCPFSCTFCSFPTQAGAYRYLDPADIWQELDAIQSLGYVNSVTFTDDTFNVPPERFKRILEGLRERQYSFRWNCNFRCQFASPEIVALMKQSGCEGVFLGIESGSDAVLANMNKRANANAYLRGIKLLRDAEILTYASFIVGFPGETAATVRETQEFIDDARPDYFRTQLWYYDTLTPIHQEAKKYGLRNSQFEWSHDGMNSVQAADWVEYLYQHVKSSVWLPQNDFDFPSLFCLTSRGWSTEQIRHRVSEFNQRVLLGYGNPEQSESNDCFDPDLLQDAQFEFDDSFSRSHQND